MVEEGQSPRDEAIKVLEGAQDLIHRFEGGEELFANEMGQIKFGLGIARLLHNPDRYAVVLYTGFTHPKSKPLLDRYAVAIVCVT